VCGFGHGLPSRCAVAQKRLDNTGIDLKFGKTFEALPFIAQGRYPLRKDKILEIGVRL